MIEIYDWLEGRKAWWHLNLGTLSRWMLYGARHTKFDIPAPELNLVVMDE